MANFEVDVDTSQVAEALNSVDFKMQSGTIPVKLQNKVNSFVVKAQKKKYKSLHDPKNVNEYARSKNEIPILKNFHYGKTKDKNGTYISDRTFYTRFTEKGANIIPRKEKYLTFKYGGSYHKVKSATINAKPFFYNTADEIWNSQQANEIMNTEMQKQLDKYFKDW